MNWFFGLKMVKAVTLFIRLLSALRMTLKMIILKVMLLALVLLLILSFALVVYFNNSPAKLLLILQIRNIMTYKYVKLFQFMVCGKSIRICRHTLTNLYYVQIRSANSWKNLHKPGFGAYQTAVDYAVSRSAATIRFNSTLSPLS